MISENTAKSLRMYGARTRTYRDRPSTSFGLGRTTIIDYPGLTADIDQLEDEDDAAESSETYHLGSIPALNDAYRRESLFYAETEPLLSPPAEEDNVIERVTSPLPLPSAPPRTWAPSTLLNRQSSIRRAAGRSRTLDFNEFTTRRRTAARANTLTAAGDALRPEEPNDGTWRFQGRFPASNSSAGPSNRAQFLPMAALVDPQYRPQLESEDTSGTGEQRSLFSHSSYPHHYPSPPPLPSTSSSQSSASSVPPRLRRGGVRAPEALLQHSTQTQSTASGAEASASGNTETDRRSLAASSSSLHTAIEILGALRAEENATQLLTPRSISPAEDNTVRN